MCLTINREYDMMIDEKSEGNKIFNKKKDSTITFTVRTKLKMDLKCDVFYTPF